MTDRYDLVVVGAGSAGLSAAAFGARIGARVALVERERVGGDCTWTGCVPSKALLHAARVAHQMRHSAALGLPALDFSVDLEDVMGWVRRVIERVYAFETPEALAKENVEVVSGAAQFRDPFSLQVDGRTPHGRRFVICTGARPVVPAIPGLAERVLPSPIRRRVRCSRASSPQTVWRCTPA